MGGAYYNDFIENKFIAIGHNEFLLHTINNLDADYNKALNELRNQVIAQHNEIERPGHVANQILRFCRELAIGDVVVLPSGSSQLSICRITGDVFEDVEAENAIGHCPFMKRRPIEILNTTYRYSLSPKAQLMFNSRHPISDISNYAMFIDDMVSDYYNKDNETHIALKINTDNEVSASVFYNIQELFKITEDFCRENGIEGNSNEVSMKVQMESKGMLHFISHNKGFLAILGLGILFLNGGGLKIKCGDFNLDLSTDGIFRKFEEHMDRKVDRQIRLSIKESLDSLEIKTPEDYKKAVIELYKTQNQNRNNY